MSLVLRYHPWSRAAGTVWALEELGQPYELDYVDMQAGEHKKPQVTDHNRMGKLPLLLDGDVAVTEAAAIAVYLADKYSSGTLAPALDAPERAPYLRWCFYPAAVIEPACMAHGMKWEYNPASAGFGTYEAMLDTVEHAIGDGPWLLGDTFSMADVVFGGTVRWMVGFKMLEPRPAFLAYIERLSARPAAQRAKEINERWTEEKGLQRR